MYIQSQLLVRLGLSIVHHEPPPSTSLELCPPLIETLQKYTNSSLKTFAANDTAANKSTRCRRFVTKSTGDPLAQIRAHSLNFTARLIAVSDECERLDSELQCSSSIEKMIVPMKHIEESLALCMADFQHISLDVHRLLNSDAAPIDDTTSAVENDREHLSDSHAVAENWSEEVPIEPEFFAGRPDPVEVKQKNSAETDINVVENRVIRQQFRPVLRQLKVRLDPINASVRDRELAFLRSKGFVDDDDVEQKKDEAIKMTDDSDSDADIGGPPPPTKTYSNRFDEMREFLNAKQQIGLFPLAPGRVVQDEETFG